MSLEQLGIIAEIVSAVAIIVTLLYLSIQVKDSARASRSAAVTDATTAMQAFYQELGSNSATSKLFLDALTKPDTLSEDARFQYLMMMHSCFLGFQRSFFLAREGTLDIALRDSIGTAIHAVNHLPGIHLYWRQRKMYFQPEFREWVEGLLAREPLPEMDAYREFLNKDSLRQHDVE
jgi:hypothetical protein